MFRESATLCLFFVLKNYKQKYFFISIDMFHSLVVPRIYLLTTLAVKLKRVPPERAGAVQICSPVVDDQKNDDGIRQEVVMAGITAAG